MIDLQQGDYTLSLKSFPVIDGMENDDPNVGLDIVEGVVIVTQTCDIINMGWGKRYILICPLVRVERANLLADFRKGRSLTAATLENAPEPDIVADIGRITSIHKDNLDKFDWRKGFLTDLGRVRFAETLERKFGRFAFPDIFSELVLNKIKKKIISAHDKDSPHGKSYRSIKTIRVTASPDWDTLEKKEITFYVVLEPEIVRPATREEINKTLEEHLGRISWPDGFSASDPLYYLSTPEEMSVQEWLNSQPVDWEFISLAGKIL